MGAWTNWRHSKGSAGASIGGDVARRVRKERVARILQLRMWSSEGGRERASGELEAHHAPLQLLHHLSSAGAPTACLRCTC